jgi:hypothetical protein
VRHKATGLSEPVLLTCRNCGKRFYASPSQRHRFRNPTAKGQPKYGYCCSQRCVNLVGRRGKPLTARQFARAVLNQEIRAGRITRPDTCARCGEKPGFSAYGRSKIHGHHSDYNKPLEVTWLCVRCHYDDSNHRKRLGSATPNSVLREEQIPEIRRLLKAGVARRSIADLFGVNKETIGHISRGKTWKHVAIEEGRSNG